MISKRSRDPEPGEQRAGFTLGNFTDNGMNGMGLECWGPVLNVRLHHTCRATALF